MKKVLFGWICIAWLMGSCASATPAQPADAAQGKPTLAAVMDSSPTSSPLPTTTQTVTPLPTIPAFTPTFDARTIVTVTLASPAECPKVNSDLQPDLDLPERLTRESPFVENFEDRFLEYLNSGGSYRKVREEIRKFNERSELDLTFEPINQDVTGDSVPEIIFGDFNVFPTIHIFSCLHGKYEDFTPLTAADTAWPITFYGIFDLNANRVPEVLLHSRNWIGVFEWNGENFTFLNPNMDETGEVAYEFLDIDNNQTKEVILKRGYPHESWFEFPWRRFTKVFAWNGQLFVEQSKEFAQPEYRFQAIQDADSYVMSGRYDKALSLYQEVIFSKQLDWWSQEKMGYMMNVQTGSRIDFYATPEATLPSPLPTPILNEFEYSQLAAYAYYRIMLLHTVRGYESDAGTVYNTLQQKFGSDPDGRPYAEMASAFWDAYQSTHKMYDGCAAAIHYAAEHPEILIPLGSHYHGAQSHTYVPADVCPFR